MSDAKQEPGLFVHFTVLDWIGVAVAALLLIGYPLASFWVTPVYRAVFQDFGHRGGLPALTRLVTQWWFPLAVCLPGMALAGAGVAGRGSIGLRRALVVSGFLLGLLAVALYLAGLYAPLFAIASAVGAE